MRPHPILIKTGILVLVLAVAAAAMGVAYGLWSDNVSINSQIITGTLSDELTVGIPHLNGDGTILAGATGNTLQVRIERPVNKNSYSYDAPFTVYNTGTLPLKIQDITISGVPEGDTAIVENLVEGNQIDSGSSQDGKVSGIVGNEVTNSTFFMTITVVPWNQ